MIEFTSHRDERKPSIATDGGCDCTLTAASLIDAITTFRIDQTSNPNESGSPSGGSSGPGGSPYFKYGVGSLFNQYRGIAIPIAEQSQPQLPPSKSERHSDELGPTDPSGPPSKRTQSCSPALVQQQPPPHSTKAALTQDEPIVPINQQTSSSVTVTTTSSISNPSMGTVDAVASPSDLYCDAACFSKWETR